MLDIKQIVKTAKNIKANNEIKLIESNAVTGFNNIYFVCKEGNTNCYIAVDHNGLYWINVQNNGDKYHVNYLKDIYIADLEKGMSRNDVFDHLTICSNYPDYIEDFIIDFKAPIDSFKLIKIFDKYGFSFVNEMNVNNGSKSGVRFELTDGKEEDFNKMIDEIKKESKFPQKIIGSIGTLRSAPEIKRFSVVVIDMI